jgi:uncharacterized protein
MSDEARPPLPPFTDETARQKVRAAEDAWKDCPGLSDFGL